MSYRCVYIFIMGITLIESDIEIFVSVVNITVNDNLEI